MDGSWTAGILNQQILEYTKELSHYQTFREVLDRIFRKAFPAAVVQGRVKEIPSFAEKATRRQDRYPDPVHMFTDLCGMRIIVPTYDQVAVVREFIETRFHVIEFDDKTERLSEEEFGYRDMHFIIQLREDRNLNLSEKELSQIGERKAEIQVRTVLQHAWAEILHDRIYKTAISVPVQWRREANRLAALLEKADESFSGLADALDSQTAAYEVCLPEPKRKMEIEALHTILALDQESPSKPLLALKLARILMTADRWKEAADVLTGRMQESMEFDLELGYALCRGNIHVPGSQKFRNGLKRLAKVAMPDRPVEIPDSYTPSVTAPNIRAGLRAKALYRLGKIYTLQPNAGVKARDCFMKAHALRPENPYYHVALAQTELRLGSGGRILPLVEAGLRADTEQCRRHVTLGIEMPSAYFTIARCHFLLGEASACLCAYARVIAGFMGQADYGSSSLLDDEIVIIEQLKRFQPELSEQVLALLHLVRWINRRGDKKDIGGKKSLAWLKNRRTCGGPSRKPVLLIIGGAELMPRRKIQGYFGHLHEALEFFQGTVVSGGTTSGIPGLVGDVTRMLSAQGFGKYDLVAYHPRKLPKDARIHPSYKIVGKTQADHFSERELIACWVDLLLAGVEPRKITALGINGGRIADVEYRLALAFGARVGVMRDSGRAAALLLSDPAWKDHPNLCVLPEDKLVVWAFVNRYNNLRLPQDVVEKAAPVAHEFYRQKRFSKGETSDESLKPWDKIREESLRESNRDQIAFMDNLLQKCGFKIQNKSKNSINLLRFKKEEIEELAEHEHARFVMERLSEGWTYGKIKDVAKKTSPYLIPWDQVPDNVKEYDREAVAVFPQLLKDLGYEIERC
ncbi:hypothetical protein JW906_00685 [bacterium]|nr:hypothetical protein [bacterium]